MLLKPTKIRSYLAAMKVRGFSARVVLAGTDLTEAQLQDSSLLVEPWQRERVVLNMLRVTGNPALGLELGAAARPVDFGVLAYALMSAASLREGISLWMQYSDAVGTTIPIRLDQRKGRKDWSVIYDVGTATGPAGWFNVEEIVAMGASLYPALAGSAFSLRECTFSYPQPPHWRAYEKLLRCKVSFKAVHTSARAESPHLDWVLPGYDSEFHQICVRYLKQVIRQIGYEKPVSSRMRTWLVNHPSTIPSMEESANYLGMSPRTLRRHLQKEETSFQDLINQVRLGLAADYLRDESMPIKEVGFELGYQSASAFRRAFKSWTGQTVSSFLAGGDHLK